MPNHEIFDNYTSEKFHLSFYFSALITKRCDLFQHSVISVKK